MNYADSQYTYLQKIEEKLIKYYEDINPDLIED